MLEAQLRDILTSQIAVLEEGLVVLNTEEYIPNSLGTRSFIDILARDKNNRLVLIELKRSDASAREAIHEIYKYVEGVKGYLGARDNEIRTIIVSTEWKELLVPFSRFVQDTSISVSGIKLILAESSNHIAAEGIEPLALTSGRILSPWHEMRLYSTAKRLTEGIVSYDKSCKAKGINDYVMLEMKAPQGFYEYSVIATARSLKNIRGEAGEPTKEDIANIASRMQQTDYLIYFVPWLQSAEEYMEIIRNDAYLYEEAKEFPDSMKGEELLCTLQEYALDADPKVDCDSFEIGYPAKFQNKLLENEGWTIEKIHRRGAFARNRVLSDEAIIAEIAGEAGTSGQKLKRSFALSDKSEFAQFMKDLRECLPNNPVWEGMISNQLEEARTDFPSATVDASIFSPSTGMMTLFFAITQEKGILYIPSYGLTIKQNGEPSRIYMGELLSATDTPQSPDTFAKVLSKYYNGEVGASTMNMAWGGYEPRDIDILEDLGLIYGSFRCDIQDDDRQFYRMINNRWRAVAPIIGFEAFNNYLENNQRLLNIVFHKFSPRIGAGMWDGSSSVRQLEKSIDLNTIRKAKSYIHPPEACDICSIPLYNEKFISDGKLKEHVAWANMCADCTVYYGAGIGWGVGQLYRKECDGSWLLVGGSPGSEDVD